ncbi:MAG: extracellular solute-binding protein [Clostridiales bacterium]|jgi:putative aldouronate transport system substrate-binding protein|nr:extracellular solute-binding protein [Clostridiales bacterium]
MKKITRVLAFILSCGLVLASCSSNTPDNTSTEGDANAPVVEASADDITVTADAGTSKLSPDNPHTFDVFFNFTWYPINKWEGIIPEEITTRTGITLNPTVAVDVQQLGVMIASGDLPDLIATDGMLSNLSTSELSYDWGGLIEQYGIDWDIPQVNKANALSFTQEEGKFFTLLSHFASTEDWVELTRYNVGAAMTGSLIYRYDLLQEMGLSEPQTMDEVKAMLIKAAETYPDKIALAFDSNSWDFTYFRENLDMGQTECNYVEDADGNWVPYAMHPNFMTYIKLLNDIYKAGGISTDNWATDGTTTEALVQAGGAFAWSQCTQGGAMDATAALKETVPTAIFHEAPVVGDPSGYYNTSIGWMGTFISKNCDDPQLALEYLKFLHSDEGAKLTQWGREGVDYTVDANGVPTFSDEWSEATLNGTMDEKYNTWFYFGGSKILEAIARCAAYPTEMIPNYPALRENFGNKPWIRYAEPVDGTDEKVIYDKLFLRPNGHYRTYEMKIITSANDDELQKNYDEMLSVAKSLGEETITAYMDKAIKEAMVVYGEK